MTKQKDFKKRIRAQAKKAGQTYAATRQAMLGGGRPPSPPSMLPETTLRVALERSGWTSFGPYHEDEWLGEAPDFLDTLEIFARRADFDVAALRDVWAPVATAACACDLEGCMRALAAAEPAFEAAGWRPDDEIPYDYETGDEALPDTYFEEPWEEVIYRDGKLIATITLKPDARYLVAESTHATRIGRVIKFRGKSGPELAWMQFRGQPAVR